MGSSRRTRHIHKRHALKGHLGKERLAKRTTGDRPSGSLNGMTRIVHEALVTKSYLYHTDSFETGNRWSNPDESPPTPFDWVSEYVNIKTLDVSPEVVLFVFLV